MTTHTRERLDKLIDAVLTSFEMQDIAVVFLDKIDNWEDRESLAKILLEDKDLKSDLKFELENEFKEDKIIIEAKEMGLTKVEKLRAFLTSEIFPFYNEQQTALSF